MIPDTTGLKLEDARLILEKSGISIEAVEVSAPPEGTGHPLPPETAVDVYVATAWETRHGSARLRIVTVPPVGSGGRPDTTAAELP